MLDANYLEVLKKGIDAARAGSRGMARLQLLKAAAMQPDEPASHLWLAWVSETPADAVEHLGSLLKTHPHHAVGQAGLAWARGMDAFDSLQSNSADADVTTCSSAASSAAPSVGSGPPVRASESKTERARRDATDQPTTTGERRDIVDELWDQVQDQLAITAATPWENDESSRSTPAPEGDPSQPLVMFVDDSPTVRKLVSATLTGNGYRVICAADGYEALQLLTTTTPDLVLTEVAMPRVDGYRLCKLLRKHPETSQIPVVILTAKDGLTDKLRGTLAGCAAYLTKPFQVNDLLATIEIAARSPRIVPALQSPESPPGTA